MNADLFTELDQRIAGHVIVPGNDAYDQLRNVFNQAGSPAGIIRVQTQQDIVEALRFARKQHLLLSVRSGGHGLLISA